MQFAQFELNFQIKLHLTCSYINQLYSNTSTAYNYMNYKVLHQLNCIFILCTSLLNHLALHENIYFFTKTFFLTKFIKTKSSFASSQKHLPLYKKIHLFTKKTFTSSQKISLSIKTFIFSISDSLAIPSTQMDF